MPITYKPLLDLMNQRNIKRTDLREKPFNLAPSTVAKIAKNKPVSFDTLERLCKAFKVGVSDIIEFEK
jgi:DNA-binding Xre family transcriptional regulator